MCPMTLMWVSVAAIGFYVCTPTKGSNVLEITPLSLSPRGGLAVSLEGAPKPISFLLVSGGGRFGPEPQFSAEIYSPPYLFKGARPTITSAPASGVYNRTVLVGTPNPSQIASVSLIALGAVTHGFDAGQRYLSLSFTPTTGGLNVQMPANSNLATPGYYMLFLVNSSGVPSVAKFVQLVPQPDFAVSATPSSQNVTQGNSTSYTVNVASSGGFAGTVGLSVSGLPQGATATFNPTSITTSGSSMLSVSTLNSTPVGSYPLTITATSGSLTVSGTVDNHVKPSTAANT